MKLKGLLFAIIPLCLFFACGEVKPPEPVDLSAAKTIIGDWKLEGIEVFIGDKAIKVSEKGLEDNFYKNSSYFFDTDKKFKFTYSDGESYDGEYTFDTETKALVIIEKGEDGEEDYKFPYLVEFSETGLSISTDKIKPAEIELDDDDVNVYYLFMAIALLEDQENDLAIFEVDETAALSIRYNYSKK
jgi:hypothetical protein